MKNLLTDAMSILGDTDADDVRTKARARRAQARVMAMINFADETARLRREQRISNLLTLAQMDHPDAPRALEDARRMLSEDQDQVKDRDPVKDPDQAKDRDLDDAQR